MIEACSSCGVIQRYDIQTSESKITYKKCKPLCICKGPRSSLFVLAQEGDLLQLGRKQNESEMKLIRRIDTKEKLINHMCYIENSHLLVLTTDKQIQAINPENGLVIWKFTQDVDKKKLNPNGLCFSPNGQIFVADGWNERLIVLNGETGELIQVMLKDEETGWIYDVFWIRHPPQLILLHENHRTISVYNVNQRN